MNRRTLIPGPGLGVQGNITTTHQGIFDSARLYPEVRSVVAEHLREHLMNSDDVGF